MLSRPSIIPRKNYICHVCRAIIWQRCSYSQEFDNEYSAEQKQKILQVMNESDVRGLSRYDVTKARIKYIKQWKNNNGTLKSLSDIDMVEGFSDKFAKKLFDSILNGPSSAEEQDTKPSKKIKGQILQPSMSESVRESCKSVLALHISVNSICWTLVDRSTYEVVEWEYHAIDYTDSKRLPITDIMATAWRVTRSFPEADLYVMKAEATTLRAAGSDPSSPKVLAVNLQKAQMVAMIVALINARSNNLNKYNEDGTPAENFKNKVYFLRPTLPYRLYGTLVGNEKVSTDQTVEILLQNINGKPSDNSQVNVSEHFREFFRKQKDLQKDMLGHCFLLALTFMDLCIYKRKESIEKLARRGE